MGKTQPKHGQGVAERVIWITSKSKRKTFSLNRCAKGGDGGRRKEIKGEGQKM